METLIPWCIRIAPSQRAEIEQAARDEGVEPSRFARHLMDTGLSMHRAQLASQSHRRIAR